MEYKCNPSKSKICLWDKQPFNSNPVFCPIYYKPKQIVRKKREYYINQNVEKNECSEYPQIAHRLTYDYAFCSKECCMAWINDRGFDPFFKHSLHIFINEHGIVEPANDWRIVDKNGGFLDIATFRKQEKKFVRVDSSIDNETCTTDYFFKEDFSVI